MEPHFLPFLELTARTDKPRQRGITIVKDDGYPSSWLREMLDLYASFVDVVKFPITFLPFPARAIEERFRIYRDYRIEVSVDDPMFQVAYLQHKEVEYFRSLADVGVTRVQVDIPKSVSAERREDEERRCMALAVERGLEVDGEVGQKYSEGDIARGADGLLNVQGTIAEARRLLGLGCRYVYLENAVIQSIVRDPSKREAGTRQIREVFDAIGLDRAIVEINGGLMPFDTAQYARFWAVKNFGPEVNMGGGEHLIDVLWIEAVRRGISFVHGETRNPRLWVNSLRRHDGVAAPEWWLEEDPAPAELVTA